MTGPLPGLQPARIDPDVLEAGKRASDVANMHLQFAVWDDIRTKWIAFNLGDGRSDGVLYDSKKDAVKHQFHEQLCAYFAFKNCPNGTNARDMAIFIQFTRDAYKAGFRLSDPENQFGGKDVAMTAGQYDYYSLRPRRNIR